MGVVRGVDSSDKDRYCLVLCVLLSACFRMTNITLTFCKVRVSVATCNKQINWLINCYIQEVELNHTHVFDSIGKDIGSLFKSSFMLLKV